MLQQAAAGITMKLLLLLCTAFPAISQKTDKKLEARLRQLTAEFKGEVGIYIKHLPSGKTAAFQADTLFPTASMIKIPILLGIMQKIEQKELAYHQPLIYRDSLLYAGEDILGSFKDGETIQLAKVIMLMMTTSDNTASLWLQSLAGTGTEINRLLEELGFKYTRVNSRTPGRKENQQLYGWGQTTPKEMVELMERIYKGSLVSKEASDRMLRIMGRNFWDEEAISVHPPTIFIASKNGAVDASRSETLLVMAPKGPYIFSIITKNQQDTSWESSNEGWVLARKLADLLWKEYGEGRK
ncbi:serine hydrolase [Flavihumibacter sp. CACIAM 22H1]|uniref:serine hydrolase n=1 Tax=Flavihumibacter sp. CACIAM 22H1 TaxID=1812911 RepID=UPI000A47D732|nr:serine hydrolase [Flavihumibacter sp. CACIAM 22H1]